MRLGALAGCLALLPDVISGCAQARAGPQPEGETVEAEGWAAVDAKAPLETRQRALAQAQRSAVEKASGLYLSATTRVDASNALEQSIRADAGGSIGRYKVVSERVEDGFLKVRIKAFVLQDPPLEEAGKDGYDRLASRVENAARRLSGRRIAVLPPTYSDGRGGEGARLVREILTVRLAARRSLSVVETGDATIAPDVDAVLACTLVERSRRRVEIHARLLSVPEGFVLAGAQETVRRTWGPSADPWDWLRLLFEPPAARDEREIDRVIDDHFDALRADIRLAKSDRMGR